MVSASRDSKNQHILYLAQLAQPQIRKWDDTKNTNKNKTGYSYIYSDYYYYYLALIFLLLVWGQFRTIKSVKLSFSVSDKHMDKDETFMEHCNMELQCSSGFLCRKVKFLITLFIDSINISGDVWM